MSRRRVRATPAPARGPKAADRADAARQDPAPSAADRILLGGLAASLALPLVGAAIGTNWLWGTSVLAAWPLPIAASLVALAAMGFVPSIRRAIERALAAIGRTWERHRTVGDLLVSLGVGVVLFTLRDPVRFVGDSELRAGALTLNVPMERLFSQAFPLDLLVNIDLPRVLMGLGVEPFTALQIVGAVVGAIFTAAVLAFLRAAGARGASLAAGAVVVLGGGYLVHFAGYDKYGPLLCGLAIAATGMLVVVRDPRGALAIAAGSVIAVLSSRIGFAILPAAFVALALAWRERRGRGIVLAAAAAILTVAALMAPRTIAIVNAFDRSMHLPGGAEARTLAAPDAPDVLVRVADGLNLLSLLVPLWLAGVAAFAARRELFGRRGALWPVAVLGVGAQLAILFTIRARQGMARDWDAYVGVALVVALALVAVLIRAWSARTRAPAVTIALALAMAFWGVHASERMQVGRIDAMLRSRPRWSGTARAEAADNLGLRAYRQGRFDESSRWFRDATAIAPNPRYMHQTGLAFLGAGKLDSAIAEFDRARRLAPRNADPWIGLANVALAQRDTLTAIERLDSALALSPGQANVRAWRDALAENRSGP